MNAIPAVAGSGPTWADQLQGIGTAATAVVALVALVVTWLQLNANRAATRETRAHQYLERYDDPQELPFIAKTAAFVIVSPEAEGGRLAAWLEMALEERLESVRALNFWEELGGMYNKNLVDRRIIREHFGAAALDYWERAWWFVEFQRRIDTARVMEQWEEMCADIRRHEHQAPADGVARRERKKELVRLTDELTRDRQRVQAQQEWLGRLARADRKTTKRMLSELRAGSSPGDSR